MAMMEGFKRNEGSRSHTTLVKTGHRSPGEKWLLDPRFSNGTLSPIYDNGVLTHYQYGGPGQDQVVIPQGRVVGVAKPVKDYVTNQMVTTVTLPGLATDNNIIGVVPYNIAKDELQNDRFGGNPPVIITEDYITLPYIKNVEPSKNYNAQGILDEEKALTVDMKMPWGAVIGAGVCEGTYLKATPSGRYCKMDKEKDCSLDMVGQVLAVDFNAEQWGWMKWVLWANGEQKDLDSYMNPNSNVKPNNDDGYGYMESYRDGRTKEEYYMNPYISNPTGLPGLHDGSGDYNGYGRNDTDYKNIDLGVMPKDLKDGTMISFNAIDFAGGKLKNLQLNSAKVYIEGVEVPTGSLQINYKEGIFFITSKADMIGKKVTAEYKAFHYGTPGYLDFKGVIGAVNVLLKR